MEISDASLLLRLDPRDTQIEAPLSSSPSSSPNRSLPPRLLYRSPLYGKLSIPPLPFVSRHFSARESHNRTKTPPSSLPSSLSSSASSPTRESARETGGKDFPQLVPPPSVAPEREEEEESGRDGYVLVSVVMTVRNGEDFLEEALDSLLSQTYVRKVLERHGSSVPSLLSAEDLPPSRRSAESEPSPKGEEKEKGENGEEQKRKKDKKKEVRPASSRAQAQSTPGPTTADGGVTITTPPPREKQDEEEGKEEALEDLPPSFASSSSLEKPLDFLEVCLFDDGSTDGTLDLLLNSSFPAKFLQHRVLFSVGVSESSSSSCQSSPVSSSVAERAREEERERTQAEEEEEEEKKMKAEEEDGEKKEKRRSSGGVGYGKNQAVRMSCGVFLCFMDADDVCDPERIEKQISFLLEDAPRPDNSILGTGFRRDPPSSTPRYTSWLNGLADSQLTTSRFRECTLLMPTWCMHRRVFDRVGGFVEGRNLRILSPFHSETKARNFFSKHQKNPAHSTARRLDALSPSLSSSPSCTSASSSASACCFSEREQKEVGEDERVYALPEDLLFLFRHVRMGGALHRLCEELYLYRYHAACMSFRVNSDLLWLLRVKEFEEEIMNKQFPHKLWAIWSVGRDGKRFYRSLSEENRAKVVCFLEIDAKKISRKVYLDSASRGRREIPIVHWRDVSSALPSKNILTVTCVKYQMPPGDVFEKVMLSQSNFKEGRDFFYFC